MITDIRLQNFKSYKDAAFEFSGGVNIIVGPNASGKTNLLEAILLLCRGTTYKNKTTDPIMLNNKWARIDTDSTSGGKRTLKITSEGKIFNIDGTDYKRLPASKTLPAVLFEPQHLLMLSGQPDLRREYMDDLIEQIKPDHKTARLSYKRALYQRNTLLKKGKLTAKEQLFAWDIRLSELGEQTAKNRQELLQNIGLEFSGLYKKLSKSQSSANITYQSKLPLANYGSAMLKKLQADTELDYLRGFTGAGPHRDDMTISIDGKITNTLSRGEVRTLLLGLKIIELMTVQKVWGQKPVLLLDDVFSELDGTRRKALTQYLKGYQTFITTTDADVVVKHFLGGCNIIPLG